MPDETIELGEVQEVLEDLSSPTDEQMMQAVRGYSERAIGSAAAKLALEGGGGGGSLPDWWTVDSTPGSEQLTMDGALFVNPADQDFIASLTDQATGGGVLVKSGGTTIFAEPGGASQQAALSVLNEIGGSLEGFLVSDGSNDLFTVGSTGAVTITPSDPNETKLEIVGVDMLDSTALDIYPNDGDAGLNYSFVNGLQVFMDVDSTEAIRVRDGSDDLYKVSPTGAVTISPSEDVIAQTVNAAAGQTENIAEWQVDGTPLAWLEADGTPGGALGGWGGFPLAAASPFIYISSVSAMSGAQAGRGVRIVCPKSGTLRDLCVYVGTSAGNVDIGVYTTDEPRARLYSSGSVACPAADGWRIVGDPQLNVVAGDQYDFVLSADDASATFGRDALPPAAAAQRLPDGMLAGGIPYLAWQAAGDIFPLPATIPEADIAAEIRLVLIGKIE